MFSDDDDGDNPLADFHLGGDQTTLSGNGKTQKSSLEASKRIDLDNPLSWFTLSSPPPPQPPLAKATHAATTSPSPALPSRKSSGKALPKVKREATPTTAPTPAYDIRAGNNNNDNEKDDDGEDNPLAAFELDFMKRAVSVVTEEENKKSKSPQQQHQQQQQKSLPSPVITLPPKAHGYASGLTINDLLNFPLRGLVAQFPFFATRFSHLSPEKQYSLELSWHRQSDKYLKERTQFLLEEMERGTFSSRVSPNSSAFASKDERIAVAALRCRTLDDVLGTYPKFATMFYALTNSQRTEVRNAWLSNVDDDVADTCAMLEECFKIGVFSPATT